MKEKERIVYVARMEVGRRKEGRNRGEMKSKSIAVQRWKDEGGNEKDVRKRDCIEKETKKTLN